MAKKFVTLIIPVELGLAKDYEPHVFPLAYHASDGSDLSKGSLLLTSTLEEMQKIKDLKTDLADDANFIFTTRVKYEALKAKKEKLMKKTYNPFKIFLNYRTARVFHALCQSLYHETRETSERIHRNHKPRSVPSAEVHPVQGTVPGDAPIRAIALSVPEDMVDHTIQTLMTDGADAIVTRTSESLVESTLFSALGETEEGQMQSLANTDNESLLSLLTESGTDENESSETKDTPTIDPTSPRSVIINIAGDYYDHSIVASNGSTTVGTTLNHGSRNSGTSIFQ